MPADGFSISAAIGYTDAEITDAGAATSIAKGDPLPNVPEWTGVVAINHDFELTNALDLFWRSTARSPPALT